MTFVQYHVPRFHRHIGRHAVVTVHLQRPRFVDVLIDIDNGRCDQRKSINTVEKINTKFKIVCCEIGGMVAVHSKLEEKWNLLWCKDRAIVVQSNPIK